MDLGRRLVLSGRDVSTATRAEQYRLLRFWAHLGEPFCGEQDLRFLSAHLDKITPFCCDAAITGLRNARSEGEPLTDWDRRFRESLSG